MKKGQTRVPHTNPNCQCGICKRKRGEEVAHVNNCQCGICKQKRGEDLDYHKKNCQCFICRTKRGNPTRYWLGKRNPKSSERMKKNSPMKDPKIAAKTSRTRISKGLSKGKNNPMYGRPAWNRGLPRELQPMYGKVRLDVKQRLLKDNPMKCREIAIKQHKTISGKNHWSWREGISFEPYGIEFNNELRLFIRQRDDFTCQLCGMVENGRAFPPHHINYNKKDNRERNLILLCTGCNGKANSNRNKWQFLFEILMEIKQL